MALKLNLGPNPFAPLARLPGMRPLLVLAGLALSVAIGVTAAFWMRDPGYVQLYGNVAGKEASEIVGALSSAGIPYRLNDATGAILVPNGKVHEARLKLAEQGLPRSSGFGLEIIGGETGLTTSQFMEGARYHHALETELARSIASLQPVQSARVHLAVPKSTVFVGKKQQPSASVLIQLWPGRSLSENQVAAVVNLVASSIPELEAGRVTVVDQQGRLLNSPGADSEGLALSVRQLDYVARIERSYVERIESLLAPMVGPGKVRATVTADVDFTQREETQEVFEPDAVVRSEQVAEERRSGDLLSGGIPGALSNQPPATATPAPGAVPADATAAQAAVTATTPQNESIRRTRNFEVDRTLSHTRQSVGTIRRLSVAVLVDEKRVSDEEGNVSAVRLSEDELAEMTRLVKDAVGFNAERGDSVTVSNVAFWQNPVADLDDGPGLLASPTVQGVARQGLAAGLIIAIVIFLVRPLLRALGSDAPAAPAYATAAAAPALPAESLGFDDRLSLARQLSSSNPERVAQIVRAWVQEDEANQR